MNRTLPGIVLIALILSSSCNKHSSTPSAPLPPPDHYAYVGGLVASGSNYQGVYWKIDLQNYSITGPTAIPNTSLITSIALSDTDVYMAGSNVNNSGSYWKNGKTIHIQGATQTNFIAVSGGNVYTEGFDSVNQLAYWVNNTETPLEGTLPFVSTTFAPSGIAAANGNVYAIANIGFWPIQENLVKYGSSAVEWINGQANILDQGGYGGIYFRSIPGIATSGSDIFMASNFDQGDTTGWAGYWKDTALVKVYTAVQIRPSIYAWTTAITVSGSDVYLCGSGYNNNGNNTLQAIYWKNNTINFLNGTQAYAIAIDGSDAYIAGSDNSGNAVIWKNGSLALTLPGQQAVPYCMVIK